MKMLRVARKSKGLTMKELGERVGVSESAISQYETGKREADYKTITKIADILDCSIDYLINGERKREESTRGTSFSVPQIAITMADLVNSNASVAEIMATLPELSNDQLNRVIGYIQALQAVSEKPDVPILEKHA